MAESSDMPDRPAPVGVAGLRRRIFYVAGFDPRGVRFYGGMLKDELARYAALTGETVDVSPRRRGGPVRSDWTIANRSEGVETLYSFLAWEDIVRAAWIRRPLALAWRSVLTYGRHARFLEWRRAATLGSGPLTTLLYPPLFSLLLPVLIALPIFLLLLLLLPWWAALIVALGVGGWAARPMLVAIRAPWLLRFFVFNSDLCAADGPPGLRPRLDAFADEIAAALREDWDEVLVVTHSNGSILAVPLMTALIERTGELPPRFALVTLGHCIPLVALRRDARLFREQLRALGEHRFRWIDIGSPPDGAAYHGVNPVRLLSDRAEPAVALLSPRFHLFFDPATYHKGLKNKYEIHFDYLRMGDHASPLALPSLIAQPLRIEEAVARFRDMP